ncbi:MAG: protein-glutamate O-methyltransferase CheR [Ignavibacteria bacterium]|nr:MAG: protein-glutamate O-methyltransferase CheR [Ignavibacteria bacterium]
MSLQEFQEWRKYIYDMTGIYFQDSKKYLLESRLQRRIKFLNIKTFSEYYNFLKNDIRGKNELNYLLNAITINETFFFRNQPQLDALVSTILPEIIQKKKLRGQNKIKIWSAASSSGEEAYSTAMMIHELIRPMHPQMSFEIVGTDINSAVLETARKGIYRDYSVRNAPRHFMRKYFQQTPEGYVLSDVIKKYVSFKLLNLYDDRAMKMMFNFDVIYCANVLIYFDTQSKIKVVNHLYNALTPGGYLFIGYSETLHGISKAFKVVSFPKTVGYKKE